jgi:hypothetical protein
MKFVLQIIDRIYYKFILDPMLIKVFNYDSTLFDVDHQRRPVPWYISSERAKTTLEIKVGNSRIATG